MKLTQEQLKQIIREELKNVMNETRPKRKAATPTKKK
jgi:predicted component of type VI protein secretion system